MSWYWKPAFNNEPGNWSSPINTGYPITRDVVCVVAEYKASDGRPMFDVIYHPGSGMSPRQCVLLSNDMTDTIEFFRSKLKSKQGVKSMFADARKYLSENKDTVFTLLFVLALDQVFFEGAFREKLKGLVDGFLTKKTAASASTSTATGA